MKVVYSIAKYCNLVTVVALVALMLITVADVLLRFIFKHPILGSNEITEYTMILTVFLGLAWCAAQKKHVSVEIVTSRFSPRVQAGFSSVTYLLCLGVSALMTWRAFVETVSLYQTHLATSILGIPTYPFNGLFGFGCAILCLVILVDWIQYTGKAVRG